MSSKKIILSDKEELRAGIRRWKGRAFADLRVYAGPRGEDEKWPTGKGFLVPVSRLHELRLAVAELEDESKGVAGR